MADIFTKAQSLFRRHKYSDVIHLLEPKVTLYRRSFKYYYYLGISCLYLRDWGSAWTYLKTAYMIDDSHISIATAYALILVRRGERQKGLEILLNIIENNDLKKTRGYKKALRGLNLIKESSTGKDFVELLEKSRLERYFPVPPKNYRPFIVAILVIITVPFFYFLIFFIPPEIKKININWKREASRNNIKTIVLDEFENITDFSNSNYLLILSDKEITAAFKRAKKNLEKYEDNLARREINRILLSNANIDVKQKSYALARMLKRPDLKAFRNTFSFEEVSSSPILFSRCFIKWSGRLSNLKINENHINFDFLVGYADKKVVEGIVPAELDFEYLLDENYAYELLAQVVVSSIDLSEENFYSTLSKKFTKEDIKNLKWSLKVVSLRRIQP